MNNWNGFFDLSSIKDKKTLKQLMYDALELSKDSYGHYDAHVDILKGFTRETWNECSPKEYIEKYIGLHTHNVVIDRKAYFPNGDTEGEIGSSTFDSPSKYLFIYLTLENLYKIVDKYKLNKKS